MCLPADIVNFQEMESLSRCLCATRGCEGGFGVPEWGAGEAAAGFFSWDVVGGFEGWVANSRAA